MIVPLLLTALAYLVGATPSSFCVSQWVYGVDLRERGSGNLGATNTFRVLGARAAVPVMALDVLKGWVPVALFPRLVPDAPFAWTLAFGAFAILGHVFSFWLGFRGGKGVATSAGVFLALAPLALVLALVVWVMAVLSTGYVSLGSILAAVALPLAVWAIGHPAGASLPLFTAGLGAFVIWAHRSNIVRLIRGEEASFRHRRGTSA